MAGDVPLLERLAQLPAVPVANAAELLETLDEPGADPIIGPLFGADEDGSLLAIGRSYKARFGQEGATYIPAFGSGADRNYPVTFTLKEVLAAGARAGYVADVNPVRRGNEIRFERGRVVLITQDGERLVARAPGN